MTCLLEFAVKILKKAFQKHIVYDILNYLLTIKIFNRYFLCNIRYLPIKVLKILKFLRYAHFFFTFLVFAHNIMEKSRFSKTRNL